MCKTGLFYRAVASGASEGAGQGTCVNMDSTECCRRGRAARRVKQLGGLGALCAVRCGGLGAQPLEI